MTLDAFEGDIWPLARWTWPQGIAACLLPLPGGLRASAARALWQQQLGWRDAQPVLRAGQRIGWQTEGADWRLSYGRWPAPGVFPSPGDVLLLARRPAQAGPANWAVDCTPDLPVPEGERLLQLYGGPAQLDFPQAWAELEAAAKLVGGLRENSPPPRPALLCSQAVGPWWVALAMA